MLSQNSPWIQFLGSPHLLALPGATQRPRQAPNTNPSFQQPLAAASPCSCSQELCTTLPAPGKPWEAPAPPPWELETSPCQAEVTALHLNVDLIQAVSNSPTPRPTAPTAPGGTHREERGVFGVWVEPLLPAGRDLLQAVLRQLEKPCPGAEEQQLCSSSLCRDSPIPRAPRSTFGAAGAETEA